MKGVRGDVGRGGAGGGLEVKGGGGGGRTGSVRAQGQEGSAVSYSIDDERKTLIDYAAAPPADARKPVASKAVGLFPLPRMKRFHWFCFCCCYFSAACRLLCTAYRGRTVDLWGTASFLSWSGKCRNVRNLPRGCRVCPVKPSLCPPPHPPLRCTVLPLCFSQSELCG